MRRILATWIAILLSSCAAAVTSPRPDQLARADAELLQGCYDCLLAARAGYRALGAGPDRPALAARLLEADLLIALREKELGLPASEAAAEAHRLAGELPPTLGAGRYVELVDAIPGNPPGGSQREARMARANAVVASARRTELRDWFPRGGLRAEVRQYLGMTLDCVFPPPGSKPQLPPPAGTDPPLLAYRRATCELGSVTELAAVRRREPRFVETSLFLAAAELVAAALGSATQAEAHLAEVLARFPASPAIHNLAGDERLLVADHAAALTHYDRALALQAIHEQAWLGRIICLTYLGRHQDAVEGATRLLVLDEASQASGYYWRARNRHALHQLVDARHDITEAKNIVPTADILGLAGVIEYDQGDLDPAEADLTAAIRTGGDCTPRWYLGLVHRQRRKWLPAGHTFEDAMTCYRDRVVDSAGRLASLQARSDVDRGYRDRMAASLQSSIEADGKQQHLAALMAASHLAAGGEVAAARPLADLAGEDPALADQVTRLRTRLAAPHAEH
jgi:tetratricopeptide (TPR) repeat protein